jgi:hypothetical protein
MSLMPCFGPDQACTEGKVIARLLAGYGELELSMCACLITVEGIYDSPIRQIFRDERGAENRIKAGRKLLSGDYRSAGLIADLTDALNDLDYCRKIRNQYSHCHWYWTSREGLCFVDLEELAEQQDTILKLMGNRHPVNVSLLQQQEDYFWYVKQCFMHLESAYRAWDLKRARGGGSRPPVPVYPKAPKISRPLMHN